MRIAFGCDHAGWHLKSFVLNQLEKMGVTIIDFGTNSDESVDYPDFAYKVAKYVSEDKAEFGVLICGTGLGMAITANKINGIRAVTVTDVVSARLAREHNNANVLTFGARIIGEEIAKEILTTFFNTEFLGGRHLRRVSKIMSIEKLKDGDLK